MTNIDICVQIFAGNSRVRSKSGFREKHVVEAIQYIVYSFFIGVVAVIVSATINIIYVKLAEYKQRVATFSLSARNIMISSRICIFFCTEIRLH